MTSDQTSRFAHLTWLVPVALFTALFMSALGGGCATTDPPLAEPSGSECGCENGAACDENGECVCQNDFYGAKCEIACDCQNGGSCDDGKDGTGSCSCPANFFGAKCESVCNCGPGQACIDGADGNGECLCPNGEPGSDCEVSSTCDCQNGGACDDSGACLCQPGFLGAKCENSCSCQNGAVCDDGAGGSGACTCAANFYGSDCSSACGCQNGGICDDGADGSGACSCPDGFWGERCENACDCGGQPCNDQTGACGECPSGSYGADCSQQCDCQNGALCDDGKSGTGTCTCQDGFFGADCSQQCGCQNGSTCNDGVNGDGTCTCASGSYGADCSQQCDCQNGAACDDGAGGDGSCSCPAGTFGSDCGQTCPGGLNNVCSGHGACDDGASGSGGCTCTGGWSGANCSTPPVCNNPGNSVGDIMIIEVMYDAPNNAPHGEPESEYVMLYNNSCGDVSLSGWELCDNAGCLTLETGALSQGTAIALIHSTDTAGLAAYGCAVNSAIKDRNDAFVEDEWFSNNLANGGDKLELKNTGGTTIDRLSYGSNSSIFNPSIGSVGPGESIHRTGYPWSGTLPANSDASAWEPSPTSGHICNLSSSGTF